MESILLFVSFKIQIKVIDNVAEISKPFYINEQIETNIENRIDSDRVERLVVLVSIE